MKFSTLASAALLLVSSSEAFTPISLSRRTNTALQVAVDPSPSSTSSGEWSPKSWSNKKASQMPVYEDQAELDSAVKRLERCSPLVFAGEVRKLHEQLARACHGQGFLLMGGDCAESFKEFNVDHVRDTFRVILQMALVLTFGSSLPVIKVGRMAGQFAKPRSEPDECRGDECLPSYRGDIINAEEFTAEARRNNPENMVEAYHQSAQTLNILRAFATGGYADISRLQAWNLDFVEQTPEGSRYRKFATKVDESLRFMKAIGVDTSSDTFQKTDFFTAHECLLLPYEQALTRMDSTTGKWYDCSAHMLWVGERTRELDGAHLEFTRGIGNPLGVKISDKCTPEELIRICDTMNPNNTPGKLTIIVRMGAEKLRKNLPGLIRAVQREGKSVLWISDPVHGNTRKTENGFKTRDFDSIRAELRAFFDVHDEMGSHPGGVHLEMTGEDVTECTGGESGVSDDTLNQRYNTACDPRLNGSQALEIAFLIAERMRLRSGLPPIDFYIQSQNRIRQIDISCPHLKAIRLIRKSAKTTEMHTSGESSCDTSSDQSIGESKYLFDGFPMMEPLKMALESDDSCDKSSCSEDSVDHEFCEEMDCDYFHKKCGQTFNSRKTYVERHSSLQASNVNFLPCLRHALQATESLSGLALSNESNKNPSVHDKKEEYLSPWNPSSNSRSPKKKAKKQKKVSVNKVVTVVPIPSRAEYCCATRQKIWSTSAELYANAARNTVEFASEGWNWRNVLEEDQMLVHQNNGEYIHPIHLQNVITCMSQASEHTDEQRQLIESLVPRSSLFHPKDTDMAVANPASSSNVNIIATSATSNATVSAQRAKECRAA